MPRGDRTGPVGYGPMTGRAAGYCAGYTVPGYMNPVGGRGWPAFGRGMGFGRGRGWRSMYYAPGLPGWPYAPPQAQPNAYPPYAFPAQSPEITTVQELEALKNQVRFMEESIKGAQERIAELEKEEKEE